MFRDDFRFIAKSGAHAWISPLLWRAVRIEVLDDVRSVRIAERDHAYTLRSLISPEHARVSNEAAEAQLQDWCALNARMLYISLLGQFPTICFHGSLVAMQEDGYFKGKHEGSSLFCLFSPRNAACTIEKREGHASLLISNDDYTIYISETEVTASEMIQRFSPTSLAVH